MIEVSTRGLANETAAQLIHKLIALFNPSFKVGLDGTACSGKGTIGKTFAREFDGESLSSGYFYRAITWFLYYYSKCDEPEQAKAAFGSEFIQAVQQLTLTKRGDGVVLDGPLLNDQNVTLTKLDLNADRIEQLISIIAGTQPIMQHVDQQILSFLTSHPKSVLVEGRDRYQLLEKYAHLLMYLFTNEAVMLERAKANLERKIVGISQAERNATAALILQRNRADHQRKNGRLLTPAEAMSGHHYDVVIDTSHLSESEVFHLAALFFFQKRHGCRPAALMFKALNALCGSPATLGKKRS